MKSKKSIYILLPIVLLIWGAVVLQFFSFSNNDDVIVPNSNISIKQFKIKPKDTFSIKINKRDPFLGKLIADDAIPRQIKHSSDKTVKVKEELIWPEVKYKGIVSDNKEKIKVYMVLIDGKTHLMRKGEQEDHVKLKDGDRETIYAVYKGDLKVIFIQ